MKVKLSLILLLVLGTALVLSCGEKMTEDEREYYEMLSKLNKIEDDEMDEEEEFYKRMIRNKKLVYNSSLMDMAYMDHKKAFGHSREDCKKYLIDEEIWLLERNFDIQEESELDQREDDELDVFFGDDVYTWKEACVHVLRHSKKDSMRIGDIHKEIIKCGFKKKTQTSEATCSSTITDSISKGEEVFCRIDTGLYSLYKKDDDDDDDDMDEEEDEGEEEDDDDVDVEMKDKEDEIKAIQNITMDFDELTREKTF